MYKPANMLRCSSFETISSCLQIIIQIFNQLDFEDQLSLSRVSDYLKSVFETYIWRQNYQSLKIYEKPNGYVVANDSDVNRMYLTARGFHEFLYCYAAGVNKLTVRNTELVDEELTGLPEYAAGILIVSHRLDIRQFPNVTSLKYYYMKVPRDHLKLIAQHYPKLQELRLINCFFDEEVQTVVEDIICRQMGSLKTLIVCALERFQIKYKQMHKLVKKLKPECLKLTALVEPEESTEEVYCDAEHLKELFLISPCNPESWPHTTYPIFLGNFKYLSILTIEMTDKVTDKVLRTFVQTCQHLEVFNIRLTEFENVQMFSLPPKLTDLSLYWCKGLSYDNLKQILVNSTISKLHSKETCYSGECPHIHISSRITSLHVPLMLGCNLRYAESGGNLKELTLYHPLRNNDEVTFVAMLKYLVNLQILETTDFHVPLDMVSKLQYLHKLTIPHPVPNVNWFYITTVLRHPPLEHLIIRHCMAGGYEWILSHIPSTGFSTNVKNLEIPLDIFELAMDFWLDIFNKNKNLKRLCCTFFSHNYNANVLRSIINHTQFPRSVQSIDICGFVLDCNDLRRNFDFHLNQLHDRIDFNSCGYGDDRNQISFQKKL